MIKRPIEEVLAEVQQNLKVPKGQKNSFGGYKYRSCEDILEAVKKILPVGYSVTASDDVIMLGDRFYVAALVSLRGFGEAIHVRGLARESLTKKGMDDSQITGTASSYARKYAANGLFAIDDTKDADTDEFTRKTGKTVHTPAITKTTKSDETPTTEEILDALASCESTEDVEEFRINYKDTINSSDSKGEIMVAYKKMKNKFRKEVQEPSWGHLSE